MARAMAFVGGLACGLVLGTAILVGHAADPDTDPGPQITHAAELAGVDRTDLEGALTSTGFTNPIAYLRAVGELENPPPLPPPVASSPASSASGVSSVWSALAQCESSGIWNRNSGNGYFGGLQEDMAFWVNHGGLAYAPRPDLAPVAAQITVAIRGQAAQGWGAWPVCSRKIGLR